MFEQPQHGGNLAWAADVAGCPAFSLLDFSASINPYGPPAAVLAAIKNSFDSLHHYPDPRYLRLRQAIAMHHQLDPDWVIPGNGAAALLTLAGRTFSSLPTTYLISPAFGDYYRSWQGAGAKITVLPWSIEEPFPWQSLTASFANATKTGSKPGLILNNPHNPTGALLSRDAILAVLPQCRWVLLDEAFMDFLPPADQQSLIADLPDCPNLIILRSLTKFYRLPGLRIGYGLAHPDVVRQWQRWCDPWPVNALAETAAIACLNAQEFRQQTWQWLPNARAQLREQLANLPGFKPLPSTTNFVLVQTPFPVSQLQRQLLQRAKILIRDCLSFPELGESYFRVAVRTPPENERLVTAIASLV